jgi:hypothetical protein
MPRNLRPMRCDVEIFSTSPCRPFLRLIEVDGVRRGYSVGFGFLGIKRRDVALNS